MHSLGDHRNHYSEFGDDAYSYATAIRTTIRVADETWYVFNETYYSRTTSRHLAKAKAVLPSHAMALYVEGVPKGTNATTLGLMAQNELQNAGCEACGTFNRELGSRFCKECNASGIAAE